MPRERFVETARLVLTAWLPGDVDDLWAVHSDPESMRHIRRGRPETREETAALIDQYIAEQRGSGFTKWRMTDVDDRFVGRAGFGHDHRGRELAYTVRRELWGRGLATEIASALVDWHTVNAGRTLLHARVAVANPASRQVLAKTGFESVGFEAYDGVECELLVHPNSATGAAQGP